MFVDVVSKNGNLLLNVGPDGERRDPVGAGAAAAGARRLAAHERRGDLRHAAVAHGVGGDAGGAAGALHSGWFGALRDCIRCG